MSWKSENVVVTNVGLQLLAKANAGQGSMQITKVVTTNTDSTVSANQELTGTSATIPYKQECEMLNTYGGRIINSDENGGESKLQVKVTNEDVSSSGPLYPYQIKQVIVFMRLAKTNGTYEDELPYMVAQSDGTPDEMPDFSENPVTINYDLHILHTGVAQVTVLENIANYVTVEQLTTATDVLEGKINDKVDKVTGKGLSTNDFTNAEKTKLAGLSNYDDTTVNNNMVRAGDADTNGQSQLYKTVNGISANIDPKCSLASSANTAAKSETVKYYAATANSNRPLLLSYQVKDTTITDANRYNDVLFSNKFYANPGTGELTAETFNGNLSGTASEAAHATSADSASNVNQWWANADKNRPLLMSSKDGVTTVTSETGTPLYSNKIYANPSTGQLTALQFNGTLNGKAKSLNSIRVYIGSSITTEGWQKVAEWTNNSMTGYYNLAITLLVTGGRTYGAYGDNIIKIFCYGNKSSDDVTGIFNSLSSILSTRTPGTVAEGGSVFINASDFKMTYTKNGKDITYKLWLHRTSAHSGANDTYAFTILNAVDTEKGTNFINDINLLTVGTFSAGATGYMTDGEVAATASVNCGLGTIGNATTGTAATATKLSGAQTVLYESTTATTSFTLSGLFTNWSAVMIYLTGAWVSGASGTHGFFVPLKHLKDRGNGGIRDFCGNKVINFLYVDDNSMRWFESQSQGAMSYSSVRVVGLY